MSQTNVARNLSPLVGLLAALALVAAAVLAGMLTTGSDQAGAVWNKKSDQAGAVWNKSVQAGAGWNRSISGSPNGAVWN